jgi:hypothetical protein
MSEGIYATINQRKDGKTLVRLVEVGNTSISHDSIHHMMSLPQQGWDPYKVLDVLLKVIKDCESIHAITECSAEEAEAHDDWAALFTEDKTQKLLVANMRLSSDVPAFERDFDERVFDSRQEALDAIYNHYSPVLMSKNLLWDLDENTFTWFTAPGKRYSFVAFNFGLEKVESCSAVTYSFEQMCDRRAVVNAINGESRHRLPEIPLYNAPLEQRPPEEYESKLLPVVIEYRKGKENTETSLTGTIEKILVHGKEHEQWEPTSFKVVLDKRFGYDTLVVTFYRDEKPVFRTSVNPSAYRNMREAVFESLCATARFIADNHDELMIGVKDGLRYNDDWTLFQDKAKHLLLGAYDTYKSVRDVGAPRSEGLSAGEQNLAERLVLSAAATFKAIEKAETRQEKTRLRTTYFIVDRQNGVFTQAIGAAAAKKKLKQSASAHTHVIAYKDLVGSPLVHPQAQDRPFRESVLAYTKEGYTQERIALILAMSVKDVSASQRGL